MVLSRRTLLARDSAKSELASHGQLAHRGTRCGGSPARSRPRPRCSPGRTRRQASPLPIPTPPPRRSGPRPAARRRRMYAEEPFRRWAAARPHAACVAPHRPRVWRRDGLSQPDQLGHRQHHLRRAHARGQPGKETAPAANRQAHKSARCSGLWRADQRRRSASEGGPSQYVNMPWSPAAAAALSASPSSYPPSAPPSSRWS